MSRDCSAFDNGSSTARSGVWSGFPFGTLEAVDVQVDERDSGWELSTPRFSVYLHESGESSTAGWTGTFDITGADVVQVIDWAQRKAGDSLTYAVALVYDDPAQEHVNPGRGRGLAWLAGMDGNDKHIDRHEADTKNRMLARRREPIVIPPVDLITQAPPDSTTMTPGRVETGERNGRRRRQCPVIGPFTGRPAGGIDGGKWTTAGLVAVRRSGLACNDHCHEFG